MERQGRQVTILKQTVRIPEPVPGRMISGDYFPVYVSVAWCGDVGDINYDIYYM